MRRPVLFLFLIVIASPGCSYLMPPQKIPLDRGNYFDAVSTSWKEELLSNLVRLRYGESLTSLEMTSVNTAYELGGTLSAGYTRNAGQLPNTQLFRSIFGPFGASANYSDKPTITYSPVRGDALAKTMIDPISPSKILKSLQTGWWPEYIFPSCIKSLNDLRNPSDSKFFELVEKFNTLFSEGVIRITVEQPEEPKVTKVPTEYTVTLKDKRQTAKRDSAKEAGVKGGTKPEDGAKNGEEENEEKEKEEIGLLILDTGHIELERDINRFKELLWPNASHRGEILFNEFLGQIKKHDFTDPKFWKGDIKQNRQKITEAIKKACEGQKVKPDEDQIEAIASYITQNIGKYEVYKIIDGNQKPRQLDPDNEKIFMQTRSILQILIMLSNLIEVPKEHIDEDRVDKTITERDKEPMIKDNLKIYSHKETPKDAFVAIKYAGFWFYIDNTDYNSKNIFSATQGIFSMGAETGAAVGTPILTLPLQ